MILMNSCQNIGMCISYWEPDQKKNFDWQNYRVSKFTCSIFESKAFLILSLK